MIDRYIYIIDDNLQNINSNLKDENHTNCVNSYNLQNKT